MTKAVDTRLTHLEKFSSDADRPYLAVYQDLEDRDVYHLRSRDADEVMTWPEIEAKYEDHVIFRVTYVDEWRCEYDDD